MAARPRRISDIKPLFTNLAQTSHYEVKFGGLPIQLTTYLLRRGIDSRFIGEASGLLCYQAYLPAANSATANISGNYMGVTETIAHTRQYTPITLEFYVDKNYKNLKFIEAWTEFIASGSSVSQNNLGYHVRMQYPDFYKSNFTKIIKFDRDFGREIEYNFIGLFPVAMNSIPVSYNTSDVMKMSVTFSYDRYIAGKTLSINESIGNNNNKDATVSQTNPESPLSAEEAKRNSLDYLTFNVPLSNDTTTTTQYGSSVTTGFSGAEVGDLT